MAAASDLHLLIGAAVVRGQVGRAEAQRLVDAALPEDPEHRDALASVLEAHADRFEPDGKRVIERFLALGLPASIRAAVQEAIAARAEGGLTRGDLEDALMGVSRSH